MIIALVLSDILLLYMIIRFMNLRNGIKKVTKEFHKSVDNKQGEQHVLCPVPDKQLEVLCAECNRYIEEYHRERYRHRKEISGIRREITNLSHDLRTPITSIIGYVEWMKENSAESEQADDMEVVKRKAEDLNRLIEQLYEFVRPENMEMRIACEPVDVFKLFKEHLFSFYPDFEAKGIDLNIDLPEMETPLYISGNEDGLLRVFSNLTSNTIRYCNGYAEISLRNDDKKQIVHLTYKTIRGELSTYDIRHLFDRFYQKDEARSLAGSSGLGLTIAKLYTEQMNGTISARADSDYLYIELIFPAADI